MTTKVLNIVDICEQGLDYLQGNGVGKNLEKAKQYFEEAASGGSPRALYHLGEMYYWGDIESNKKKSYDLLQALCERRL